MTPDADVVVIGGGQSGLAAGYHLRRLGVDFVILDARTTPGGAWRHTWDSLHLFSPAAYSSLPGRLMPPQPGETYPDAAHVVSYLTDYEESCELPIQRPVRVKGVHRHGPLLRVSTDARTWHARVVVSATGTWWRPFLPTVPGRDHFTGVQLHAMEYRRPKDFAGQRVVVVGGGNSGAQIAADLAYDTDLTWVTRREARFLADDIDGRALFDAATARRRALDEGRADTGGVASLGDIVAVPPVREARDAGLLKASPMFSRVTATVSNGPTAPGRTRTRSSGAPVSGLPSPTWRPSACAGSVATSPRQVLGPRTNPDSTCSDTATGPAPPRPPSSAWAAPPAPPLRRSPPC